MDSKLIVKKTAEFIKKKMIGEGSGHDWWHVYRVWQLAKKIGQKEKADMFIVELGALLHDIADWKFNNGDLKAGSRESRKWLETQKVDKDTINKVCHIVENVSYQGAGEESRMESLEGKIVQDADRLDALGAIGIARCFAYGGSKSREIHNPTIKPQIHKNFEEYKSNQGPSLNHFYEKLLLLKDLMNTKTAKELATKRHKFVENYLKEFLAEWKGI